MKPATADLLDMAARVLERLMFIHLEKHPDSGAFKATCDAEWCALAILAEHLPNRWSLNVFGGVFHDDEAEP